MNFDSLVLSGGGYLGISALGFLYKLFDYNAKIFNNIKVMAGCSIGSVLIVMLAMGYMPMDILTFVVTHFKMPNFSEISIDRLQKKYGVFNIEDVMQYLYTSIENKLLNKNITFAELSELCGKELVINCFNLTDLTDVVFSTRTTPNEKIIDAVRYSISIPLFFDRQIRDGKVYVDGGIHNNMPIEYIYEPYTYKKNLENTPKGYKDCISIEYGNLENVNSDENQEDNLMKYIYHMLTQVAIMASIKKNMEDYTNIEFITIQCKRNITSVLKMNTAEIMKMFDCGCNCFDDIYNKNKKTI